MSLKILDNVIHPELDTGYVERNKKYESLNKEYAESNNSVKIGDFVTDHIGTIKVEKMSIYFDSMYMSPSMVYNGTCYTKNGIPMKDKKSRSVYQNNLIKVINVEDRILILLKATFDILKKCKAGPYVNVFEQTAIWDDAECDGSCLMEEIAQELGLDNELES